MTSLQHTPGPGHGNGLGRREFLQVLGATGAASALSINANAQPSPIVQVDRTARVGKLPAFGLGFSMEKHLVGQRSFFTASNQDFAGCCRRLGQQVFRIGGDHADQVTWDPNGPGGDERHISPADIDALAGFVKALGWKVILALNLAYGTPQTTAEEAKAAADALGDALLAFEIGNEPNLYVRHGARPQGYDYAAFMAEWQVHAQALRAAVPGARISGPGAYGEGWRRFGIPFAHDVGSSLYMLTSHYYCANGKLPGATVERLLDDLPHLYAELEAMAAAARDNGVAAGFRMVETNTFVGGGADGVSDAAVSALWAVEYGLRAAELGVNGLNFQLGPPSHSNTSLAILPGRVQDVRPQFYGIALLAGLGQGDMLRTTIADAPRGLTAHAVQTADGRIIVVLINITEQPVPAQVSAGPVSQIEALWLRAPSLLAQQGITYGGAMIGTGGSGAAQWTAIPARPNDIAVAMPPASAVCLRMT